MKAMTASEFRYYALAFPEWDAIKAERAERIGQLQRDVFDMSKSLTESMEAADELRRLLGH